MIWTKILWKKNSLYKSQLLKKEGVLSPANNPSDQPIKIDPKLNIFFNTEGKIDKNLVLRDNKGIPIYSCDGNISDQFRELLYKNISEIKSLKGMRIPEQTICTITAGKVNDKIFWTVNFWQAQNMISRCYSQNICEANSASDIFGTNKAQLLLVDEIKREAIYACLDLNIEKYSLNPCK